MPEQGIKVLADTSFFIRLLKDDDPLHSNAKSYLKHVLDHSGIILCSTISIAEYCVKGSLDELPLRLIQIVPFNATHAVKAGGFARICFESKVRVSERVIIPNDCKLLAQAEVEAVQYYLTSDRESKSLHDVLTRTTSVHFQFVDIRTPVNETFGFLDFPT